MDLNSPGAPVQLSCLYLCHWLALSCDCSKSRCAVVWCRWAFCVRAFMRLCAPPMTLTWNPPPPQHPSFSHLKGDKVEAEWLTNCQCGCHWKKIFWFSSWFKLCGLWDVKNLNKSFIWIKCVGAWRHLTWIIDTWFQRMLWFKELNLHSNSYNHMSSYFTLLAISKHYAAQHGSRCDVDSKDYEFKTWKKQSEHLIST